jgi:repressor LexA
MNPPLTERQQQVYNLIREKIMARGYGPTVREIAEALEIRSPNGVMCHLKALERKGVIRRIAHKSRAIELSELIERDDPKGMPIAGRLLGDICSFSVEPTEVLSFDSENRFALQVVGDALKDLHILPGDSLIIQRQTTVKIGQIALVTLPKNGTRLFYWMPETRRIRLQPLDRSAPIHFVDRAEVVGVLVGLIRSF